MKHNKIKPYWLLLPALLLAGSIALTPGQAYARYTTTATCVAVIDIPSRDIRSNCLVAEGEAPRTVFVGQLKENETLSVPFWLLSSAGDEAVKVNWGVTDEAYKNDLAVSVALGNELMNSGEELLLPEGSTVELALQLAATEVTGGEGRPARTVDVQVTVGDTLKGIFRAILPGEPVPLALPAAEEAPQETVTEEIVEPLTEVPTPADPTETTAPTDPAQPSEPIEPTEPELTPEQKEALMTLKTIPSFLVGGQLPVRMILAEHITEIRFGVQNGETLSPLPDYTMFSLDGGESYYMTYGAAIPRIATGNAPEAQLLLDLRYAQTAGALTLALEAYQEQALRKTCTVATIAEQIAATPEHILTFDNKLEFSFPTQWTESQIDYTVERLTVTEDNHLTYVPVELSDDGLRVTYTKTPDSHALALQLGQKFNQAGTYRLRITWNYEGICYDATQTTFLINCLGGRDLGGNS